MSNFSILFSFCIKISVCKQCRSDQTPRLAASVLGLHCFYMYPKHISSRALRSLCSKAFPGSCHFFFADCV